MKETPEKAWPPAPDHIIECGLSKIQQRIYIERLEQMLDKYPLSILHNFCPASSSKNFQAGIEYDKRLSGEFNELQPLVCHFCRENVGLESGCPCRKLGCEEAVKRGRELIKQFRAS